MAGDRRTWRRVLLLGVPALYIVLGILHPTENPELGDDTDLFISLHVGAALPNHGSGLRALAPG